MPPPVPLPPLASLFDGDEAACKAYARLAPLENEKELVIRILGQMLIQAPAAKGRAYVAMRINDCTTDQMVIDLGQSYLNHFIAYFQSISETFSTPKELWSPSSSEEDLSDSMADSIVNRAEVKQQALIRDNYRCMLTGTFDKVSIYLIPWLMDEVTNSPDSVATSTHCCPILRQYVSHSPTEESRYSTTLGTIADLFGNDSAHELIGSAIDDLSNLMTLSIPFDEEFSSLKIWLEPVEGAENQYHIKGREFYSTRRLPPSVTFSSTSTKLPLPDPHYLAVHAACARVIQLTGAAKHIGGILRNGEE